MAERTASPQHGEQWRAHFPTPWGPGPVTSLVRVIEVVRDLHRREIVRYHQTYPTPAKNARELPLASFTAAYVAPYEDEDAWWQLRRGRPTSELGSST